jgi:pimeloyl-ACP methyl ester carboxylesterase
MAENLTPTTRNVFGTELDLLMGGSGRTILILHGAGGPELMRPFAEKLAATANVCLPTHPGFDADEPAWLTRVEDLAYFYLDVLETLDLRKVCLVGHSLGGWIAAEMAIRSVERIERLMLVSSAGFAAPGFPAADNFLWSREETLRNLYTDPVIVEAALGRSLSPDDQMKVVRRQQLVAKLVWNPRWHNPALARWLPRIRIPTDVVWGDEDRLFPVGMGAGLAEAIPGARFHSLPGCGHVPFVERSDQMLNLINRVEA